MHNSRVYNCNVSSRPNIIYENRKRFDTKWVQGVNPWWWHNDYVFVLFELCGAPCRTFSLQKWPKYLNSQYLVKFKHEYIMIDLQICCWQINGNSSSLNICSCSLSVDRHCLSKAVAAILSLRFLFSSRLRLVPGFEGWDSKAFAKFS